MVNYRNQNIYNKLNKPILNVKKNKRKTLKLNNNINNSPRTTTMQNMDVYKVAFPPTHIRDWTDETQSSLSVENTDLGWMGSNNMPSRNSKGPNSIAHDLEALPIDPLVPVPVPLKDLQPMNNNANLGRKSKSNTIFAHNLRGLAPRKTKTSSRVPWYAQSTAASRSRVKATDVQGRQKEMEEHYRKIGLTRRTKRKNRRSK